MGELPLPDGASPRRSSDPAPTAAPAPAEIARILALHPIFAPVEHAALVALAAGSKLVGVAAGETILRQGDHDNFACAILDGEADVFVEIPAGQIQMATVGHHRLIGEMAAMTEMPRSATVIARTPLTYLRIERDSLLRLAAQSPSLGISIITELGRRLHGMNRSLAYLTYAATALGREEYDPAMIDDLLHHPGELANFARAFAAMATELQNKQRRHEEMLAAAAIQSSILPPPLQHDGALAAIDLHAEMHPAREIGGDFYDFYPVEPSSLVVTIADVSGKGIPAALFMAVSRTVLRSVGGDDLAARMQAANRLLSAENSASMFVTLFHGVLDLASGHFRYCNAGHNPPYLLRAACNREALKPTGIPFGIDADLPYRTGETVLRPGDALFLFTDGITEAFNPAGEEFGNARLEAALETARAGRGRYRRRRAGRDPRLCGGRRAIRRHHLPRAGVSRLAGKQTRTVIEGSGAELGAGG